MAISYSSFIDYMFWKSYGSGVPFSGNFELTARCNLDCKMCYIHKKENDSLVKTQELSTEQWIQLAREAKDQGLLLLLLTGGEPFLRPDFCEIYTACQKMGILLSINTNGTMITDEMVQFLKDNPPLRMNITLYGASKESYKNLCGDEHANERVYSTIKKLKQAGIRIKLNYSVTPQNMHDAEAIYQFAKEQNLLIQTASYMFPPVRALECSNCTSERLTPQQAGQARWNAELFRYEPEVLEKRIQMALQGEAVEDSDKECQELPTERIRCRAGATTFWITYKGEMRPCGMMQIPSVDTEILGFAKAWKLIREERNNIMLPAKCTSCRWNKICEFCPATCYAENHSFEIAPEYICQKTEAYLACGKAWLENR